MDNRGRIYIETDDEKTSVKANDEKLSTIQTPMLEPTLETTQQFKIRDFKNMTQYNKKMKF